jgi:hypothetical protein
VRAAPAEGRNKDDGGAGYIFRAGSRAQPLQCYPAEHLNKTVHSTSERPEIKDFVIITFLINERTPTGGFIACHTAVAIHPSNNAEEDWRIPGHFADSTESTQRDDRAGKMTYFR